jgi:hypothetical protein
MASAEPKLITCYGNATSGLRRYGRSMAKWPTKIRLSINGPFWQNDDRELSGEWEWEWRDAVNSEGREIQIEILGQIGKMASLNRNTHLKRSAKLRRGVMSET